jgi:broad specificity phosphatase PhoE
VGTLTLVRHGQASYGAADYDRLSERGVAQARALGRRWAATRLVTDAVYTGPMRRQRDTAALAVEAAATAGHRLPAPVVLDELAEYPAFELLGRFMPRFAQEHPELRALIDGTASPAERHALMDRGFWLVIEDWCNDRLDTGDIETFGAFVTRVSAGVARITASHGGGGARAVAVTSGGPIGIALKLALGLDAIATVAHWRLVRNASVTELLWRSRAPAEMSLLGFNHVDHLDPEMITFR